jgi:hypothetical protein
MNEHNYIYTSDDYNLNRANSYKLLLQVHENVFSYLVISGKQLLAWSENCPVEELAAPNHLKDILTAPFKEIITGVVSGGFTLLPQNLFDNNHVADVARMLDVHTDEYVFVQPLDKDNAIIYKAPLSLANALANLKIKNINHNTKGWVSATAATYPSNNNLYLNIAGNTVEFLYYHNDTLRFYNTFIFNNREELAYYTAFVSNKLQLSPADTTLILSGEISQTDEHFTYLADFFGNVTLNNLQVLDAPEHLNPHQLLTIAALNLCASSEED